MFDNKYELIFWHIVGYGGVVAMGLMYYFNVPG